MIQLTQLSTHVTISKTIKGLSFVFNQHMQTGYENWGFKGAIKEVNDVTPSQSFKGEGGPEIR